jgi:hypothetical protein
LTDREKLDPYLATVIRAADEAGVHRSILAAIGFRESHFTWAPGYTPKGNPRGKGDAGHGHGIWQIDDRTWGDWLKKNDWGDPLVNARKACSILRDNYGYLKLLAAMPAVPPATFERIVIAAYNAGPSRARKGFTIHGNPDHFTAGGDYSIWVVRKAADLRVQIPELNVGPMCRP